MSHVFVTKLGGITRFRPEYRPSVLPLVILSSMADFQVVIKVIQGSRIDLPLARGPL